MKELFVFAQPRSGSTLLQRLINSDKNFCILGEHVGILKGLSQSWTASFSDEFIEDYMNHGGKKNYYNRGSNVDRTNEWTGLRNGLTEVSVSSLYRNFVEGLLAPARLHGKRVVGFKEIRYGTRNDHTGRMLMDLYPESRFILLYRNPLDLIRSQAGAGFFPGTIHDRCDLFIHQMARFMQMSREFPDQTLLVNYEQLRRGEPWMEFIGSRWTETHDATLKQKNGFTRQEFQLSEDEKRIVVSRCEFIYKAAEKLRINESESCQAIE